VRQVRRQYHHRVPDEDKPERRADTRLEALLRGRGLLDPGDDIAGRICASGGVLLALAADQAEPTARDLDRGCCCAISSRRLYLPQVTITVDLERVWRAECWGPDLALVWAAFILQVRRFFGTSTDADSMSAFMSSLAALLAARGGHLDLVQAEAMVRWALGGPAPELSGLAQDQQLAILAVVAGFVAEELQMTPKAIWLLAIRSEQMTLAGGLNLPPSSSSGTGSA
jgi:hypothetical protein